MIQRSSRLDNVFYEIRGPIFEKAQELERHGYKITKLNIGNPAPFGFDTPDEIIHDMILNLRNAQGYTESKGLFAARKAIMHYSQSKNIRDVQIDDIIVGNGVSELILLSMQALLDDGDEILIPSPDYPLWTAAVTLSGGKAVHYICDEESDWYPDLEDMERKITSRTKGIVVINPNNPTGAVYPTEVLEKIVRLAEKHNLIVFSDEIYDKILYDDTVHVSTAALSEDVLFLTFSGLSKNYRAAGFRAGWVVISGNKAEGKSYIEGLNVLASMRLCSNAPAQFVIQTALGGYQSIADLVLPGGRLRRQRDLCYEKLTAIPGITCTKPKGAFYMFPKIDVKKFNIQDDQQFVLDFLCEQHVLLVQGSGFNWQKPDHFRVVYLPALEELNDTLNRLALFLEYYKGKSSSSGFSKKLAVV
ncbi:pyridoxal phosphate-dependent aminotransferase [Pontibacter harenae]|uniref:pyridoxal phosphate-dependent aminotransferase n=1 Tax=Pontibacter harenae TaxID=2894083 RepID=UPI001E2B6DE1|nr:pyridoxal phosphate-dependent aminotransferase [Pontibacter harenae]MCC9167506.1 pyridoxal phosphate-dependent aminotransferase [Pontibacter harenae]